LGKNSPVLGGVNWKILVISNTLELEKKKKKKKHRAGGGRRRRGKKKRQKGERALTPLGEGANSVKKDGGKGGKRKKKKIQKSHLQGQKEKIKATGNQRQFSMEIQGKGKISHREGKTNRKGAYKKGKLGRVLICAQGSLKKVCVKM